MKKILLFSALAALGIASCIKDNSNPGNDNVNKVAILLTEEEKTYLEDKTVRIEPELITQTLAKDESNLSFVWKYSNSTANAAAAAQDTLTTERFVDIQLNSTDTRFDHYLRLLVTDNLTTIVYPYDVHLRVIKPFMGSWAVLHDQGGAKLGAVEYVEGETPTVHTDVLAEFGRPALTGAPVALGQNSSIQASVQPNVAQTYVGLVHIYTDNPAESGVFAPWSKFLPVFENVYMPQMVRDFPTSGFDMAKVTDVYTNGTGNGTVVLHNGQLFQGRNGFKLYPAVVDASLGAINIAKWMSAGAGVIIYDDLGKRFLWYNMRNNGLAPSNNTERLFSYTVGYFHDNENNQKIIAMERQANASIDQGKYTNALTNIQHEVLHIGIGFKTGTNFRNIKSYAIANGANNKSYVYLFPTTNLLENTSEASLLSIKEIDTPEGMDANSCFASSTAYEGIIFYSSGDTVYRLDYNAGSETAIYKHGGGTITEMRFAVQEPLHNRNYLEDAYGFDFGRSLGIAVNRAGSGDLVVLNLDESGTLAPDSSLRPSTAVYTGFGEIKGITIMAE